MRVLVSSAWQIYVFFAAKCVCMALNSTSTLVLPCIKCRACSSIIHRIAAFDSWEIALHASGL
eukprot:13826725-Ditylum_brightwellii.AAC.1